jgi:hypothetical protein
MSVLCITVHPHIMWGYIYKNIIFSGTRWTDIGSIVIPNNSYHRCAFGFRFRIHFWSYGGHHHIVMNWGSSVHKAFNVPVAWGRMSKAAPKDMRYVSCSHCRHACQMGRRWLRQLFIVVVRCSVHLHKDCIVVGWRGQGAVVSQCTCQTTHASTEALS